MKSDRSSIEMYRMSIWVFLFSLLIPQMINSEAEEVKRALINFLNQLSPNKGVNDPNLGWNMTSDPCIDHWHGVICDYRLASVKGIILDNLNLTGSLNAYSLCAAQSLTILSLNNNSITGEIPQEIGNCKQLTHLYISNNHFTGNLPASLSDLNNLKRLDISNNDFSGILPDFPRISGLVSFFAENNHLTGPIPEFDFLNLQLFNVSFNNFVGPVPDLKGRFSASSFMGNPGLCGPPLPNACPPTEKRSKGT